MRLFPLLLFTFFGTGIISADAQNSNLYIFKNERKEHLNAARKARKLARERKLSNDYYIRVKTLASLNEANVWLSLKIPMNAEVVIADMNGNELALLQKGELDKGSHEFKYIPEGAINRPFVCTLKVDGKTEAMRVVKFNSF